MISILTRFLAATDYAMHGMTPRGIALGLHAAAGHFWPNPNGCYVLFAGTSGVDYTHAVGAAPAGATTIKTFTGYALPASSTVSFGLRAVSPGGVSEANVGLVQTLRTNGSGVPITPAPNAPTNLIASPRAGGKIGLSWQYRPTGQQAAPAAYAVYHDDGTGTVDYVTPLAVVTGTAYLTAAYADAAVVKFGVRARTAGGAEEVNTTIRTATADAVGPADIEPVVLVLGGETA